MSLGGGGGFSGGGGCSSTSNDLQILGRLLDDIVGKAGDDRVTERGLKTATTE